MTCPRALVIEDDGGWREEIRDAILDAGFDVEVRLAANAQEALAALDEADKLGHPFRLITVDLSLADDEARGRVGGRRVLSRLAASKSRVVVISGHASPDDVRDFFVKFGAVEFFSKSRFSDSMERFENAVRLALEEPADTAPTKRQTLAQLHQKLVDHFSLEELRTLCFQLGVRYDDLSGRGLQAKARELLIYLENHRRLPRLLEWLRNNRPEIEL